jgi:hypothetical protein
MQASGGETAEVELGIKDLPPGLVASRDVRSENGLLLLRQDTVLDAESVAERTAHAGQTVDAGPIKERTYGESTCTCGTTFVKKSPTQMFHAKECRRRLVNLQL